MRFTGDRHQKIFPKNFRKMFFLNFSFFEKLSIEKDGFPLFPVGGKLVLEPYACPFEFFVTL